MHLLDQRILLIREILQQRETLKVGEIHLDATTLVLDVVRLLFLLLERLVLSGSRQEPIAMILRGLFG